jgi:hypothetical protein
MVKPNYSIEQLQVVILDIFPSLIHVPFLCYTSGITYESLNLRIKILHSVELGFTIEVWVKSYRVAYLLGSKLCPIALEDLEEFLCNSFTRFLIESLVTIKESRNVDFSNKVFPILLPKTLDFLK